MLKKIEPYGNDFRSTTSLLKFRRTESLFERRSGQEQKSRRVFGLGPMLSNIFRGLYLKYLVGTIRRSMRSC